MSKPNTARLTVSFSASTDVWKLIADDLRDWARVIREAVIFSCSVLSAARRASLSSTFSGEVDMFPYLEEVVVAVVSVFEGADCAFRERRVDERWEAASWASVGCVFRLSEALEAGA